MLNIKTVRLVLFLGLLANLAMRHAYAASILDIQPSNQVVQLGGSFSVDVRISDAADLYAFQFDLMYSPLFVSGAGITEGPFLRSGGTTVFVGGTVDNNGGTISSIADSLVGFIPGVSGTGTLATINFHAIAPGTSAITLSRVTLLDSGLAEIASITVDGAVTIVPVPEPATGILMATSFAGLLAGFCRINLGCKRRSKNRPGSSA